MCGTIALLQREQCTSNVHLAYDGRDQEDPACKEDVVGILQVRPDTFRAAMHAWDDVGIAEHMPSRGHGGDWSGSYLCLASEKFDKGKVGVLVSWLVGCN